MYSTPTFIVQLEITDDVKMWLEQKKKLVHKARLSVSLTLLPHFDGFCDIIYRKEPWQHGIYLICMQRSETAGNSDVIYASAMPSGKSLVRTNQNSCPTSLIL